MIKGIIFDLDGTLLDTVKDISIHLNNTLKEYGYESVTKEEIKSFLGNGSKTLVSKALKKEVDEKELDLITDRYVELYNDASANVHTKPYDGIMELLAELKMLGIKTAITSNKMQEGVTELNETVFNKMMDIALGESPSIPLKPNPTMLFKALEIMGLNDDEVLFVGDTEVDLLAATNASFKSVAVSWGFRKRSFLEELTANYIIDTPLELVDIIETINALELMTSGNLYLASTPALSKLHSECRLLLDQLNDTKFGDYEKRTEITKKLFGSTGSNLRLNKPFYCDYGINISVGDNFFANFDCVMLDVNKINIGNNVFLGPKVSIYTASHPIDAEVRATYLEYGLEVNIGNDVWIGGNAVINPGVTIGDNVIVGSGSVVTKDIPSGVIVGGNPAVILRNITDVDKDYWNKQKNKYYE